MAPPSRRLRLVAVALAAAAACLASPSQCATFCPRADTARAASIVTTATAVLEGNWVPSMNSTLPSPNLYPHQWSWDASFVSMGYSHYDTRKAVAETDALFRAQWRNGAIPHIVFNPAAVESYFPGPDFWRVHTAAERGPAHAFTSGIIQPPVHAIASLAIFNNAPPESRADALAHLHDVYPKLAMWHDYLYRERDPLHRGLVFIRHMWESGMDNSPAWDPILDAMVLKEGDVPPYKRADKGKVGHDNERPDTFFYDRAVHLIKVFYDNQYDERRIFDNSPFIVEDVLFNSILARAGASLARIADVIGLPEEARAHRARADWTATAIVDKLYHEEDAFFYDYDLVAKRHIRTRISGGLVAVFGANLQPKHLHAVVRALYSPGFLGEDLAEWTLPSVSRDDPEYTNSTYWKGPAWININYLVRDGLMRHSKGADDAARLADHLKERSLQLMEMSGYYEYFNPISGAPHGGHDFSWSAALAIDWVCGAAVAHDPSLAPVPQAPSSRSGAAVMLAVASAIVAALAAAAVRGARAAARGADAAAAAEVRMADDEGEMQAGGKRSPLDRDDVLAHNPAMRLRARPARRVDHRAV